ncbi:solute carrier family 35 member F1-like isoform X2 [Oryza brachyantha]|uniref:solute carrier family 35 member F1-like isoform X2 n=1 Tax=Oryza brachyantha TaxID=4533 RepID=UPI001AD9B581|nr:solute carrier family 35 member F1-like isoform X2 [Oryza brachyantha]
MARLPGGGGCPPRKTMVGLGLGQLVSLLVTGTGFASSELSRRGINVPTSQSLLNYLFLGIVYGSILLYRRKPLQMKWYYYLILGLVDVEANYLVVKAYQYTSLTSVMLLDCWSIPAVIFLTWMFLKTKYRFRKYSGVAICVAGLVLVVFSDVHAGDRAGGASPVKGDILVIAGATLYAISNVSEEFLVKVGDRVELMGMLGLFGAIISACQISIFERNEIESIQWSVGAVVPFIGFAVAMFMFYSLVPILLKISGSTMLNLSLLTSDMWAILIRVFAYHEKVDWMYYVAFGAVAIGLVIYSGDSNSDDKRGQVAESTDAEGRLPDEEAAVDPKCQGAASSGIRQSDDGNGLYHALSNEELS